MEQHSITTIDNTVKKRIVIQSSAGLLRLAVNGQGSGWKPEGGGDRPRAEGLLTILEQPRPLNDQPPDKGSIPGNYPFTNRSCSQQEFFPWGMTP